MQIGRDWGDYKTATGDKVLHLRLFKAQSILRLLANVTLILVAIRLRLPQCLALRETQMGLAQMGLAIKTKLTIFVNKMIPSKLDAYKAKTAHALHAQNSRCPQRFPKPLGPWAMKMTGLWQKHFLYVRGIVDLLPTPLVPTPLGFLRNVRGEGEGGWVRKFVPGGICACSVIYFRGVVL